MAKLNAGRAVTAVALGSSFVANQAGCFHTSLQQLYDRGVLPNPHIYPLPGADPNMFGGSEHGSHCDSGGYMEAMMATINATWPHPGHMAFNHGAGGFSLEHFMMSSCIDAYVPQEVDIVLLDATTASPNITAVEYWIRKFMALPSRPLVVLIFNTITCLPSGFESVATPKISAYAWSILCAQQCLLLHDGEWCARLGPEPYSPHVDASIISHRNTIQSLANYYRVPHVNLHSLMTQSLLTTVADRVGTTKYEMMARMYMDAVHFQECHGFSEGYRQSIGTLEPKVITPYSFPCVKRTGEFVVADILVDYLVQMQDALGHMPEEEKRALHYDLPNPVHADAGAVHRSRCYGISYEQVADTAPQGDAREELARLKPGDGFNLGEFGERESGQQSRGGEMQQRYEPLPQLNITLMHGFKLVTHYTDSKGKLKFKPGYVASGEPGAVMEIVVDTSFDGSHGNALPEVRLSYTTSYDGWGKARVTCLSGCTCTPGVIDAASAKRHSLLVVHRLPVTQSPQCAVRVEVLEETSSAGRKFKIATVAVKLAVGLQRDEGTNGVSDGTV
ncbi:hypothetical protein FOA52_003688 [Chlamydomonas sp. UWO 241]|nr:hypothetical protein FOA52_003688 [Chlamydomonas sp. UWO 241]